MPCVNVGQENSGDIDLFYEDHGSRCHGKHPTCRVRARRTLQVPLRIALQQTVSASTPRDVPLP